MMTESEAVDYPESVFWLPTDAVGHYDDPDRSLGDEGWDPADLLASLLAHGQAEPILVGMSRHDLEAAGDRRVYAFNGNHRLQAMRKAGIPYAICENSEVDDAESLTIADVLSLGGSLSRPAGPPVPDREPGPGSPTP